MVVFLTSKDLSQIVDELEEVVEEWMRFGVHLPGVAMHVCKRINHDYQSQGGVELCKYMLIDTWLGIRPDASWNDVCTALRKVDKNTLACKLEKKYISTTAVVRTAAVDLSLAQVEREKEKVDVMEQIVEKKGTGGQGPRLVEVKKEVIVEYTTKELTDEFSGLMEMIKMALAGVLEKRPPQLQAVLKFVEETASGLVHMVHPLPATSIDGILPRLDPCYDFLDCDVILALLEKFITPQHTTLPLLKYIEKAKRFRSTATVELLMEIQSPVVPQAATRLPKIVVKLEEKWKGMPINNLYILMRQLLPDTVKKRSLIKHAIFSPDSTIIEYVVTKDQVAAITQHVAERLELFKLIGVCHLYIGDCPAMYEDENPDFSLESSLLAISKADVNELVLLLLDLGANVNCHDEKGMTPLMYASASGHVNILCTLLFSEAEVDLHIDDDGITALMVAAINGNVGCITHLLEAGSVIDQQFGSHGWAPLAIAAGRGHYDAVDALLEKGADPNLQNKFNGWTALMFASQEGHLKIAGLLLQKGADPNIQSTEQKWTALMSASSNGHYEVASLLLDHNANPDLLNANKVGALRFAVSNVHFDIAELLLERNANPNLEDALGITPLMIAGLREETRYMRLLIGKGADLNTRDSDGETSLYHASLRGFLEVAVLLLDNKANPDVQTNENATALMAACAKGHLEMVKLLLSKNADPNIQGGNEKTALILSVDQDPQIARELLEHGAKPDIQDKDGRTALIYACKNGCHEVTKLLLEKFADPRIQCNDAKWTAMMYACIGGHFAEDSRDNFVKTLKYLMLYGVDVTEKCGDKTKVSPIRMSCAIGDLDFIKVMLNQEQPLQSLSVMFGISCFRGHAKVAIFFLLKIRGIDEATVKLATACIEGNDAEVISMIIESKVDVRVAGGITPLMIASACGHEEVVRLLAEAEYGKYVNYTDEEGLTALDYAEESKKTKVVTILQRNGALSKSQISPTNKT